MSAHAAAVRVDWAGEGRFDATRASGGPSIRLDSSGATGPNPVDGLLASLASCISVDVVEILGKRRTPPSTYTVHVHGERVDTIPRRIRHVTLAFVIGGEGIDRAHAERAIDLSITKYCSVRDSLREDIGIDWTLTLENEIAAAERDADGARA
jgi:putative redox protein